MRIAIAALMVMMGGCAGGRCYTKTQPMPDGADTTYWMERHPTTRHGICATLYQGMDGKWEADHPWGVSASRMSLGTESKEFTSQAEALAWIDVRCK